MPFARVGALPQQSASSNNGRSSRSRSKGITMEDLKKQTAIRLAQEQKLVQAPTLQPPSREPTNQHGDHVGSSGAPQQPVVHLPPSLSSHHLSMNDIERDSAISQYQQTTHHQQPHLLAATSPMIPIYSSQRPQVSYIMQQHQQHLSGGYLESGRNQQTSPTSMGHYSGSLPSTGYSQGSQMYLGPTSSAGVLQRQSPPSQAQGACSGSDTSRLSASTVPKAKLPHGLTVHELKEMTKARLQAEAAEKTDTDREVSPLDSDASGCSELRERARSRDSTGRHNPVLVQPYNGALHGELGVVLVPSIVHVQDVHRPSVTTYGGRQFPGSPLPPGSVGHQQYMCSSEQSVDVIAYRTPARSDTWDSTSVGSYNSASLSENLSSDPVLDIGSFVTGNRTRSFTYPAIQPSDGAAPGLPVVARNSLSNNLSRGASHAAQPAFDAAVGGNRRRAVTLSPNTGSILEDRPHYYGEGRCGDQVQIPTFSTRREGPMMHARRQRNYSPVLEQLGLTAGFADTGNSSPGYRGSSNGIPLPSIPQGGTPGSTSLCDPSTNFFREAPGTETRVPAPPGFLGSENDKAIALNRHTAFSRVGSVEDVSGPILGDPGKVRWNVVNRPHLSSVEDLARDLGCILNLSGSSRPDRERANTYTYGSKQPSSYDRNPYISDAFIEKDLNSFPH